MNKTNRILLAGSMAVVFVCAASSSKANLILSGSLVGVFQSSDNPNTQLVNSANGDASFRTGTPVANSFQSGVNFSSESFSDLASGDETSLGMFTYLLQWHHQNRHVLRNCGARSLSSTKRARVQPDSSHDDDLWHRCDGESFWKSRRR